MPNFVQQYRSTDLNAPPIMGQTGSAVKVFNAILVDGYGWSGISIISITRSGSTATATVSASDGQRMRTGHIYTIAGANQPEYNITTTITRASATTFTFTVAGTPATPATGTITCDSFLRVTSITRGGTGNLTAIAKTLNANSTLLSRQWMAISGCTGTGAAQYNVTAQISIPEQWAASTAYVVPQMVTNDSGKVYVCRTAGTSASSGGPTGTGSSITDGTAVWDYVDAAGTAQNYFAFQTNSDPGANASGSPVYCKAGLGWSRPFAPGTNAQTYKSTNLAYTTYPIQLVDNANTAGGAREAQIYAAETMSADQTVTSGRVPTTAQFTNGYCLRKSTDVSTTEREWTAFGDNRLFFFIPTSGDGAGYNNCSVVFGNGITDKPGDAFDSFVSGGHQFNSTSQYGPFYSSGPTSNSYPYVAIFRPYSQAGSSVPAFASCLVSNTSSFGCIGSSNSGGGGAVLPYPNGPDQSLRMMPIFLVEQGGHIRMRVPGVYAPLHVAPLNQYDIATNVVGLPGVTLTAVNVSAVGYPGQVLFDTYGPWD